jgi:hypothetical protein
MLFDALLGVPSPFAFVAITTKEYVLGTNPVIVALVDTTVVRKVPVLVYTL